MEYQKGIETFNSLIIVWLILPVTGECIFNDY